MASAPFNIAEFGLDAASLAGSLARKLDAISAAGFSQLSLEATDLIDHPGGVDAALRLVARSGLRVAALSALRDFEGLGGAPHAYKVAQAKDLLALCARSARGC